MNIENILISAAVGTIFGIITAYITTRIKVRAEKEKWDREFSVKYAEIHSQDRNHAQNLARQFAIGVLIVEHDDRSKRERIFVPPHCRLVAGRSNENEIFTDDSTSRKHTAFSSDAENVYVEDLGSHNATFLNDQRIQESCKLKSDDKVKLGHTVI